MTWVDLVERFVKEQSHKVNNMVLRMLQQGKQ